MSGAIIGYDAGFSDIPGDYYMVESAYIYSDVFSVIGFGLGAAIGSAGITYLINGNVNTFSAYKEELNKYAIIKCVVGNAILD